MGWKFTSSLCGEESLERADKMTTTITTTSVASTAYETVNSMGYSDWWCPCGISKFYCAVALRARGAGSFANSKVNLAAPGVTDAEDVGSAPAWDDVNGWTFDGTEGGGLLGIYPSIDAEMTVAVRFSNYDTSDNAKHTILGGTSGASQFSVDMYTDYFNPDYYYHALMVYNMNNVEKTSVYTSGVLVFTKEDVYKDGAALLVTPSWDFIYPSINRFLGIGYYADTGSLEDVINIMKGSIQALAVYGTTLTPTQVADLSQAMAAL